MSNCTCGKTTRPPLCDGSHWLSDKEYAERTEKLNKLFKKETTMTKIPNWVDQISGSIPEHCQDIADDMRIVMSTGTLDETDCHACALVAAICSGNGDLAYEISMSDELRGKAEREAAKTAAALVTRDALYSTFDAPKDFSNSGYKNYGGVDSVRFKRYLLAGIVTLRASNLLQFLSTLDEIEDSAEHVAKIASVVGAVGKVAL